VVGRVVVEPEGLEELERGCKSLRQLTKLHTYAYLGSRRRRAGQHWGRRKADVSTKGAV
jgi:hypothetical protein